MIDRIDKVTSQEQHDRKRCWLGWVQQRRISASLLLLGHAFRAGRVCREHDHRAVAIPKKKPPMRKWFQKVADGIFGTESADSPPPGRDADGGGGGSGKSKSSGGGSSQAEQQARAQVARTYGPVLMDTPARNGPVQGFAAIDAALRKDEDGDEAHDFLIVDTPPSALSPRATKGIGGEGR